MHKVIIIFIPIIKGNNSVSFLPIRSKLLHLRSYFTGFQSMFSWIIEFFETSLGPVVHFHRNGRALRSNSLVTFRFHLQHVFNICFQNLLPILAGSYNPVTLRTALQLSILSSDVQWMAALVAIHRHFASRDHSPFSPPLCQRVILLLLHALPATPKCILGQSQLPFTTKIATVYFPDIQAALW